ncbi:dihydroorotate dehydrogenase [Xinfangfangia sp. CPCC 101601]|uniref:Dihydroorotate dehydrogenase n=1 Tax=Pseudogemmobacter lacusdianii TaxID=3069608 RepID=A0ABU0VVY2_9RHOB|nr:dihydroorotate dehydrogenase [Xinfangfangia sp. CPCC 101601]MDQ2065668.1 dihydroorotate dehydrogenase [Xinfangfangia sp. CPCC 101601]
MTGTDDLDGFFAAAREAQPAVSPKLMAQVLADAAAFQPQPRAKAQVVWWQRAYAAMAELWGGFAPGLATAAVAGLAFGYAGPLSSDWLAGVMAPQAQVQMMAASDLFLAEEFGQ